MLIRLFDFDYSICSYDKNKSNVLFGHRRREIRR